MNWQTHSEQHSSPTSSNEEVRTFEGIFFSCLSGGLLYWLAFMFFS